LNENELTTAPIFVWRSTWEPTFYGGEFCQYCDHKLTNVEHWPVSSWEDEFRQRFHQKHDDLVSRDSILWQAGGYGYRIECTRCGFYAFGLANANWESFNRLQEAALKSFDINSQELAAKEIWSHLTSHHKDLFAVSPRRFEEVIAAVYRELGARVTLTAQTRDGGKDLVCIQSNGDTVLVEIKRYAEHRKVGIGCVDRLLGALVRHGAMSAHLITTSAFSRPAIRAREEASAEGYELKLMDGFELLKILETFSDPKTTPKQFFSRLNIIV
jgi:HJR/Mrr/RecB family endonuclease